MWVIYSHNIIIYIIILYYEVIKGGGGVPIFSNGYMLGSHSEPSVGGTSNNSCNMMVYDWS